MGDLVGAEAEDESREQRRPELAGQPAGKDEGRPGRSRRGEDQRQVERRDRARRGRDRPHEQGHRGRGGRPGEADSSRCHDLVREQRVEPVDNGIGPPADGPNVEVRVYLGLLDMGHIQMRKQRLREPEDHDHEVDHERDQPLQHRPGGTPVTPPLPEVTGVISGVRLPPSANHRRRPPHELKHFPFIHQRSIKVAGHAGTR
jgi:hypothetical protein